ALHRDGHEIPVELTIWPIQMGGAPRFNAFLYDVSERLRAKQVLEEKLQELETLNRVMLGREERILELKEELAALHARLSAAKPGPP
ncbi:MAG: PAS domain S-box protein, partial [Nevskiales bacterium]